jgi:hypothetical protein
MAFDIKHLSLENTVDGLNKWVYKSAGDTHATVDTAGYFSGDAVQMLRVGDLIDVVVFTDGTFGTVSTYGRHIVLSNNGTTVNVSDVTAGTVTNTD